MIYTYLLVRECIPSLLTSLIKDLVNQLQQPAISHPPHHLKQLNFDVNRKTGLPVLAQNRCLPLLLLLQILGDHCRFIQRAPNLYCSQSNQPRPLRYLLVLGVVYSRIHALFERKVEVIYLFHSSS